MLSGTTRAQTGLELRPLSRGANQRVQAARTKLIIALDTRPGTG